MVVNGNLMRQVHGFSRYAVNRIGIVWDFKREKMLVPNGKDGGYRYITLIGDDGSRRNWLHHRLVAMAWIENPKRRPEVNHIDGVKTNNHVENLEWVSHRENMRHAFDNGLIIMPSGENHFMYGKQVPKETKKKMSAAKIGEKHPRFKGWYLTPLGRFDSLEAAGFAHGVSKEAMYKRFRKIAYEPIEGWGFEPITAERHRWMDWEKPEPKERMPLSQEVRDSIRQKVSGELNYRFTGYWVTELGRFESLEGAALVHGVHKTTMLRRFRRGFVGYGFEEK